MFFVNSNFIYKNEQNFHFRFPPLNLMFIESVFYFAVKIQIAAELPVNMDK